jgi:multiple sugar transport system permease protein
MPRTSAVASAPGMATDQVAVSSPALSVSVRKHRLPVRRVVLVVALSVGAVLMLFPFIWTVVTSISANGSVLSTPRLIPSHVTLAGYRQLFSSTIGVPIIRVVINSIVLALASMVLGVLSSAMAAYAFARLQFRFKNVVFVLYLATLMIPLQVLVVPLFIEMRTFHLVNSYIAVLAPTIASATGVFLIRQAIQTLPTDLDEAATIDGAGHLRIFFSIIVPNVRPALATFAVFAFMASWNNLLWPLVIINSPDHMTLPLALSMLHGEFSTQWNVVMAGSVLSIAPILLLYAFAQKYVVQGMATTGLK